ncbi:hypothetical protein [Arthrobacter sp. CJ23]|uniref:hypothetical protein n=1 Tax=Arthrobacter sp. CJ23 TaxID=2972479 RepID=UPI00215C5321|nr:hypothetical protein [Arthrobacter sp. CJ23]UVJ40244.1 hypothetical protein NVV90_03390 [Arthrobacter sp. CJ23]
MPEDHRSPAARLRQRIAATPRTTVDAQGRPTQRYVYTYDEHGNLIKAEPVE